MKVLKKLILTLTLVFMTAGLFAKGFNDAVEENRRPAEPSYNRRPVSESTSSSNSCFDSFFDAFCDSFCDAFCEVCTTEIVSMWASLMSMTRFRAYPYANGNDYIWFSSTTGADGLPEAAPIGTDKFSRWSVSDSPFYMNDKDWGWGNDIRFEGVVMCVGPYFELMTFDSKDADDSQKLSNGNLRLGGQFALFQSDPFSAALICQWSHWYGDARTDFRKNGVDYGFQIQSYPFNPFHLDWRFLIGSFEDDLLIYDSVATIGIMVNRFELMAGWKYIKVTNSNDEGSKTEWNGITAGARIYF